MTLICISTISKAETKLHTFKNKPVKNEEQKTPFLNSSSTAFRRSRFPLTLRLSLSLGHFLPIYAKSQRFSIDMPNFEYLFEKNTFQAHRVFTHKQLFAWIHFQFLTLILQNILSTLK